MPIYNEEKYIVNCIESLLTQDYPKDKMEWIFVDGKSSDNTLVLIEEYMKKYPELIAVCINEKRITPISMNIGIRNSKGEYIIRLDAHADYARDYISKCVEYLRLTKADNVGGLAETKSVGFVGNVIAKLLSNRFGVGNSQFRIKGKSGYVDTVPFGAFRREVFKKYGGFDERLVRNQDNEMNYRIRKNGGKIYLSENIHFSYYCRDTISGLISYGMNNGKWNIITSKLCPGTMGLRHFVPLIFVLSLIGSLLFGSLFPILINVLSIELLLYFSLSLYFAVKNVSSFDEIPLLVCLFPVFHVSYGIGSLGGLLNLIMGKYRLGDYTPPII